MMEDSFAFVLIYQKDTSEASYPHVDSVFCIKKQLAI